MLARPRLELSSALRRSGIVRFRQLRRWRRVRIDMLDKRRKRLIPGAEAFYVGLSPDPRWRLTHFPVQRWATGVCPNPQHVLKTFVVSVSPPYICRHKTGRLEACRALPQRCRSVAPEKRRCASTSRTVSSVLCNFMASPRSALRISASVIRCDGWAPRVRTTKLDRSWSPTTCKALSQMPKRRVTVFTPIRASSLNRDTVRARAGIKAATRRNSASTASSVYSGSLSSSKLKRPTSVNGWVPLMNGRSG